MGVFRDLTGERFGWLVAIERAEGSAKKTTYWKCVCDCGNEVIVRRESLTNGDTKSCGCFRKAPIELRAKMRRSGRMLYMVAWHLFNRCNNPEDPAYHNYGGRGIECRIGDSPANVMKFLDNLDGYFLGAEIDRIDNNGHYEDGNLRWSTLSENTHNRRVFKNNTSGVKGVRYNKILKTWKAEMMINLIVHAKSFCEFEDAVQYRQSLEEYYYLKQFIKNGYEVGVQK